MHLSNKKDHAHLIKKGALVIAGISLLVVSITPAGAISLRSKKKAGYQLPVNDKIDLADLLDKISAEDAASSRQAAAESGKSVDLTPLSLGQPEKKTKDTTQADSPKGALKASVRATQFVPKGPLEGSQAALAPASVKGSKSKGVESLGSSLMETAKSVNAAPIPLIESDGEIMNKLDEERELEREQLTALWEATITRSPNINFVLKKLLPSSDHSKVTTVLMRALSTAMYAGVGAVGMMNPSPGGMMMQNAGISIIGNLLGAVESNAARKAKISQTESIMLYTMIRQEADKLVNRYRDYKLHHKDLLRANNDFADLKEMAVKARSGQDASEQFHIDYTLRKQQRDIEKVGQTLGRVRLGLVDLAGAQAVQKLDKQIDDEFQKLHPELIDTSTTNPDVQIAGAKPNKAL